MATPAASPMPITAPIIMYMKMFEFTTAVRA
jgi:hypothetical protein